jgi:hypothetical protein
MGWYPMGLCSGYFGDGQLRLRAKRIHCMRYFPVDLLVADAAQINGLIAGLTCKSVNAGFRGVRECLAACGVMT